MLRGSALVNTPGSRSRALLRSVTRCDHRVLVMTSSYASLRQRSLAWRGAFLNEIVTFRTPNPGPHRVAGPGPISNIRRPTTAEGVYHGSESASDSQGVPHHHPQPRR